MPSVGLPLTREGRAVGALTIHAATPDAIVNELISNALKHAFADGRHGDIRVEAHPVNGGPQIRLVVADSGVGLPVDFEAARQPSLGLQLVADLARQLHGTLDIRSDAGTTFSLTFAPRTTAGSQASPRTS